MLQLAAVFSDHMVLQREKNIVVFGNYHRFHSGTKIICFYHRKRRRQLAAAISAAACRNGAKPVRKRQPYRNSFSGCCHRRSLAGWRTIQYGISSEECCQRKVGTFPLRTQPGSLLSCTEKRCHACCLFPERTEKPLADAKPDQCCGMVCRGIPCRKRTFTETGCGCRSLWLQR